MFSVSGTENYYKNFKNVKLPARVQVKMIFLKTEITPTSFSTVDFRSSISLFRIFTGSTTCVE